MQKDTANASTYKNIPTFTTKRSDIFTKNLINQLAVVAGVCAQVAFNFPLNDLIIIIIIIDI